MDADDINRLESLTMRGEARRRAAQMSRDSRLDAPAPLSEGGTAQGPGPARRAVLQEQQGVRSWWLEERPLAAGAVIEIYTNAANGWVRGRFEWSGRVEDAPTLAMHCWDPQGEADADGLPPWVGELVAPLPKNAVLRWAR